MTLTLALQLYLFAGLIYGVVAVVMSELVPPRRMTGETLKDRVHHHATVLALALLVWPVALLMDRRARS